MLFSAKGLPIFMKRAASTLPNIQVWTVSRRWDTKYIKRAVDARTIFGVILGFYPFGLLKQKRQG